MPNESTSRLKTIRRKRARRQALTIFVKLVIVVTIGLVLYYSRKS